MKKPAKLAAWDRTKGRPEPIRALNRIPEVDNQEPLVNLLEYTPRIKLARESVIPYVRKTVAEMCTTAAESLPEGVTLGLIEGWRPFARQQRIYAFMWKCAQEAFPDRDHAALRRTVCRWVAPVDQKAPPGHCTGAAVDVVLLNENNEQFDVTSPYERWTASRTYTLGLTAMAQANRDLLVNAMLGAGFSNCRDEWWHYSYGDAGWAVRANRDRCFYGLVHLPEELYAELELEHAAAMDGRPNPFMEPTAPSDLEKDPESELRADETGSE